MRTGEVGIVGGGAWGSALASVAAAAGNTVRIWRRAHPHPEIRTTAGEGPPSLVRELRELASAKEE